MSNQKNYAGYDLAKVNTMLMCDPPENWVTTANGSTHVPIQKMLELVYKIFSPAGFRTEILKEEAFFNEYKVMVRVYLYFPDGWRSIDGIGVVPIQQRSGTKITEFAENKIKNAGQKNIPAAYSHAITNALEMFPAFGMRVKKETEITRNADAKDARDEVGKKIQATKNPQGLMGLIETFDKDLKKKAKELINSRIKDFCLSANNAKEGNALYELAKDINNGSVPSEIHRAAIKRGKQLKAEQLKKAK